MADTLNYRSAGATRIKQADLAAIDPLKVAHTVMCGLLFSEGPAHVIRGDADPEDVEDRADHIKAVLAIVADYVRIVLNDTASNVPADKAHDIRNAICILTDATHDLVGEVCFVGEQP